MVSFISAAGGGEQFGTKKWGGAARLPRGALGAPHLVPPPVMAAGDVVAAESKLGSGNDDGDDDGHESGGADHRFVVVRCRQPSGERRAT